MSVLHLREIPRRVRGNVAHRKCAKVVSNAPCGASLSAEHVLLSVGQKANGNGNYIMSTLVEPQSKARKLACYTGQADSRCSLQANKTTSQ